MLVKFPEMPETIPLGTVKFPLIVAFCLISKSPDASMLPVVLKEGIARVFVNVPVSAVIDVKLPTLPVMVAPDS